MRSCSIEIRTCASLWIAAVILMILTVAPACSDNKVSKIHIKLEDLPQDKSAPIKPLPAPLPVLCPPAGVKPLEASAPQTSHHKVFLRWNASKTSKDAANEVVGYCLYRSTKKKVAKKDARCQDCEQVNRFPVKETRCVDDLVKDGATYYYVATAISRNRDLSTPSNEILVEIPRARHPIGHPPPGFYPSCRATPAENESPSRR